MTAQASQREQSIRIQSSGGLSEEDIQNMVRDAESYAEKDKERKAAVEAKNEAETAIYSAEKSLADYKDKVSFTCNTFEASLRWPVTTMLVLLCARTAHAGNQAPMLLCRFLRQ